jgi:hypothetical protein
MPKKKYLENTIKFESLGEAVNYQAAIVKFFDAPPYKWYFRLLLTTVLTGLTIGIRTCSMQEKVNIKEILPTSAIEYPFSLIAQSKQQELFKIDKDGNMFGWGNWIGRNDQNFLIYKIEGKEEIIIIDKRKNKIHLMDTPESIR